MYQNKNKSQVFLDMFNGKYPSTHLNNQIRYFQNVKRELEARQTKVANLSYRNKLKEQQNKENYLNEIQRIRGELSKNDNRLPIGTRERLEKRVEEIKNLKYGAFNKDY